MQHFIAWITLVATTTPLVVFVFLGSILEEIFPPIPAPLIMSLAGYLAHQRGAGWAWLFFMAVAGAVGKIIASLFFYGTGMVFSRQPERFAQYEKHRFWGNSAMVTLRVLPVIPTFVLSIGCGFVRLPIKTFLWTTFLGTVIRNIFLIVLGIFATEYVAHFWETEGQELSQKPLMISAAITGVVIGVCLAFSLKKRVVKAAKITS